MPILTLAEYKTRRQITEASQERDEALEAAIAASEDAVLQYTGRDFTTAQAVETRAFPWEIHTTILETDDFVGTPTGISFEIPGVGGVPVLPTNAFWVGPREGATHYYIDFTPARAFMSSSSIGAMGFTRNLDTYFSRGGGVDAVTANVTAEFGWPGDSPASVKQAVTWLVDEFYAQPPGVGAGSGEELQSESIADLTYAYQREPTKERAATLPPRVQQLLDAYRRIAL